MFVGSVPRDVVNQLAQVIDLRQNDRVYVCCSGSFRVDLAVQEQFPGRRIYGNDVSLLSCAVGKLLIGQQLDFRFTGDLEFIEKVLEGQGYTSRIAALSLSLELSKYNTKTEFGRKHANYYHDNFVSVLETAKDKIEKAYGGLSIDDFFMGDFQEQARSGIEADGFVIGFPPTYKGGYERMYKRVDENTDWKKPEYGLWDPDKMAEWLLELKQSRVRHCVFVDHQLEGFTALAKFSRPRSHPIYLYGAGAKRTSLRIKSPKSTPFAYTPIDPMALTDKSEVDIAAIDNGRFNFLRNKYLAKGIQFVDGMANFLVVIDGCVAGGFSISRMNTGDRNRLYLLSDFSIRRERRLAKLIAMIAATKQAVRPFELKMMVKTQALVTTVFTDKPVSMKYRGIYELIARKPGFLQYQRNISELSPQEIYSEWLKKHGKLKK